MITPVDLLVSRDVQPTPDGYFRLVGAAHYSCGLCGCCVAPEMRERHRKLCVPAGVPREPLEEMTS